MATRRGPSRQFFDAWARVYDFHCVQWLAYRPLHDAVLRVFRHRRPRTILDVGCGTGQLAARVARDIRRARVVGADLSAGMLGCAASRDTNTDWVQGDATCLPFCDRSFDAVVSTSAFHWFADQAAALREMRRVLAPRGCLLLVLVSPRAPLLSCLAHAGSQLASQPFYWPTASHLREQVTTAGLRVRTQRRVFRLPGALLFPTVLTLAERPA